MLLWDTCFEVGVVLSFAHMVRVNCVRTCVFVCVCGGSCMQRVYVFVHINCVDCSILV